MSDENPHKGGNDDTMEERPDKASSVDSVAGASDINPSSSPVTRPGWLSTPPPTKPQDEALMRALAKINAIDDEADKSSEPSISPVISPVQRTASNPSSVRTWAPNPELFSSRRSTVGPLGSSAVQPNISSPKPESIPVTNTPQQSEPPSPQPDEQPAVSYPPPAWKFDNQPTTTSGTTKTPQNGWTTTPAQPSPQDLQQPQSEPSKAVQAAMHSLFSSPPAIAPDPPSETIDTGKEPAPSQPGPPNLPWSEPPSAVLSGQQPQATSSWAPGSQYVGEPGTPAPQVASASPRPKPLNLNGEQQSEASSDPSDYSYPIPEYTTIGSSPAAVALPISTESGAEEDIETGVSKLIKIVEPPGAISDILGPDFGVNADEIDPGEFILDERKDEAFPNLEKQKSPDLGPGTKFSLVGQVLYDSYALLDAIGESERCEVYSAMQLKNDILVAIKTPKGSDPTFLRNFGDAVKTHGKLKHPNIIRSLAYLESGQGQPFYVMENIGGVTLEEILASVEKLDDEEAIGTVLFQAAAALEYAHLKKVFHGRLTPHNILMADQNDQLQAKLMDFQIAAACATASDTRATKGDDPYLSPETHNGQPFSARSDIYSLGVIAYRVSTGIVPEKITDTSSERNLEPVAKFSPELRHAQQLDELIQQALEPEPSYRFENATQFKAAVQEWIQNVHDEFDLDAGTGDDGTIDGETGEFESGTGIAVVGTAATAAPLTGTGKQAPDKSAKRKRRRRRKKGQLIRTTIHQLVELKRRQHNQEQTAVMRFTESVSAKGPRQSPLMSLVKLVVAITLFAGLGLGSAYYIISNSEHVKTSFTKASRQLSGLLPGRSSNRDQKIDEAGQIRVGIEPMIKASGPLKLPPKPKSKDIHATPQFWALPEGKRNLSGNQSPSFGVTNNWQGGKKGNRRIIQRLDGK